MLVQPLVQLPLQMLVQLPLQRRRPIERPDYLPAELPRPAELAWPKLPAGQAGF